MKAAKQSWSEVGPRPAQEIANKLLIPVNVTETDVILQNKEWFAGECNRKIAEDLLLRINKVNKHFLFVPFFCQFCSNSPEFLNFSSSQDGAFLIRHSSAQNTRQPFTLAVLYQQKVYNIPIRFLEELQGYVLGKEGKKNEEVREKYAGGEWRGV